jgi:predicted hydrocarbon binding protein
VIWTAVTDGSDTLRYRAGDDAVHLLDKRKVENDETFFSMFKFT